MCGYGDFDKIVFETERQEVVGCAVFEACAVLEQEPDEEEK